MFGLKSVKNLLKQGFIKCLSSDEVYVSQIVNTTPSLLLRWERQRLSFTTLLTQGIMDRCLTKTEAFKVVQIPTSPLIDYKVENSQLFFNCFVQMMTITMSGSLLFSLKALKRLLQCRERTPSHSNFLT